MSYASTLNMEVICVSETSADFQLTTRHYIPQPSKSYIIWVVYFLITEYIYEVRGKAIPVTGCGGPQGCETPRFPHFLDNRLTDGREVVSLTPRPPFTPRKIADTHSCQRLSRAKGHSAAGRIRSMKIQWLHRFTPFEISLYFSILEVISQGYVELNSDKSILTQERNEWLYRLHKRFVVNTLSDGQFIVPQQMTTR
jgi:hypothetical protein